MLPTQYYTLAKSLYTLMNISYDVLLNFYKKKYQVNVSFNNNNIEVSW